MAEDFSWYQNAVFYEVYVRAFFDGNNDGKGDLSGLTQKLDYFLELGVTCLWLLPIYPSPLKDDGYDISDYYGVHPDFGTLDDFKALLSEARARGLRVIMDLVLNHTSDQHRWFQDARMDRNSPFRDYYVWSDTDQKYSQARIIFVDTEKSNWTWDDQAGQYYWHRFFASQPDLNFENQAVQEEMIKVMTFWLDLGVDGFRADAVPYLFEREGSNCENLPETHLYLKRLRKFIDEHYPGRVLLCEANQWPKDVLPYFGAGDEFQMAFNFPLMPRIFMALRQEKIAPIQWVMEQMPVIPPGCQWCTFLRNHDELTLEMVTAGELQWMWKEYAPDLDMRLNLGIRRRLAPLLDNDLRKIGLAFALIFSLPGTPIIYYGDEIGMGDNVALPDRNGVRTPMQWSDREGGGFSTALNLYSPVISSPEYSAGQVNVEDQRSDPFSLWSFLKKLISLRKEHPAFGLGEYKPAECGQEGVLGFFRKYRDEEILVALNLSNQAREIDLPVSMNSFDVDDLWLGKKAPLTSGAAHLRLGPYDFRWLKL